MRTLRPVPLMDGVAYCTFPAGIVCIDHYDWNASFPYLVFNEHPALVECPGVVDISLALP